jgi:hypothetical protein
VLVSAGLMRSARRRKADHVVAVVRAAAGSDSDSRSHEDAKQPSVFFTRDSHYSAFVPNRSRIPTTSANTRDLPRRHNRLVQCRTNR